jgi:hypothetical protein
LEYLAAVLALRAEAKASMEGAAEGAAAPAEDALPAVVALGV